MVGWLEGETSADEEIVVEGMIHHMIQERQGLCGRKQW